jgi:hypothetical protein
MRRCYRSGEFSVLSTFATPQRIVPISTTFRARQIAGASVMS